MESASFTLKDKAVKQAQAIANDAKFCISCPKKITCKSICPELEKTLPKPRSGGHSKEFPVDPQKLEGLAVKRAFELKFGKHYGRTAYEE
jgi:hypothetical protein